MSFTVKVPSLPGYYGEDQGVWSKMRNRFERAAIKHGQRYLPNVTRRLTMDKIPEFEPWDKVFAYTVIIATVFMDLLQFYDVFTKNKKILIGVNFIRLLIYIVIFAFTSYSVYYGYRTVGISLRFQIITTMITGFIALMVCMMRINLIIAMPAEKRTWQVYMVIIFPLAQVLIAIAGLYYMFQAQKGGDIIGSVPMLKMATVTLLSIIITVIILGVLVFYAHKEEKTAGNTRTIDTQAGG